MFARTIPAACQVSGVAGPRPNFLRGRGARRGQWEPRCRGLGTAPPLRSAAHSLRSTRSSPASIAFQAAASERLCAPRAHAAAALRGGAEDWRWEDRDPEGAEDEEGEESEGEDGIAGSGQEARLDEGEGEGEGQGEGGRVAVFWDLDNKQPLSVGPVDCALRLRSLAQALAPRAHAVDLLAYANRHAFEYVPERVREERRLRREQEERQEHLRRTGALAEAEAVADPLVCSLCGRRCTTAVQLRKHFLQLHQREHQKRVSHLQSLSPRRRRQAHARLGEKVVRYRDAAAEVVEPRVGYGLMRQLRQAGVHVRLVSQAPQAADEALKADMQRAVRSGLVALVVLVSDDRGYSAALHTARTQHGLRTAVVSSMPTLQRWADVWLPWDEVVLGSPTTLREASRAAQDWGWAGEAQLGGWEGGLPQELALAPGTGSGMGRGKGTSSGPEPRSPSKEAPGACTPRPAASLQNGAGRTQAPRARDRGRGRRASDDFPEHRELDQRQPQEDQETEDERESLAVALEEWSRYSREHRGVGGQDAKQQP